MFHTVSIRICGAVLATLGGIGFSTTANAEQAATRVQIFSDGIVRDAQSELATAVLSA